MVRAGAKWRWRREMGTHPGVGGPGLGGPWTTHGHRAADVPSARRRSLRRGVGLGSGIRRRLPRPSLASRRW